MQIKTPDIPVEPLIEDCESEFLPIVRSGAWTDIGYRSNMEDVYVCLDDFMHHYGLQHSGEGPNAFYGVLNLSIDLLFLQISYMYFCHFLYISLCYGEEGQNLGACFCRIIFFSRYNSVFYDARYC